MSLARWTRFGACAMLFGLLAAAVSAADLPEITLWSGKMPEPAVPADMPERSESPNGIALRYNISRPRLVVYRPPVGAKSSKTGVIVVPGGGFGRLADGHEGSEACEWLAKAGVTSFLLLHRTPTDKHPE
ncbi:MAG: hypothetical protein ACO1SX_16140, partial [Actinomycetota bacterium]